jgi:tRNA-Thr(GGU) m(6)t(6)A37 methyltransferase TsaA
MEFSFPAIGIIHSCFKEKFGIPRQPGLAPLARGQLELFPPYNNPAAVSGLDACSHLWIQFVFHANRRDEWKPKVKPPRLGGNKSLGTFATRSPIRPNPIGLSVVKLDGIEQQGDKLWLTLSGIDLLDGTPILDIKPYVPYVDCITTATNAFAPIPPAHVAVSFASDTKSQLNTHSNTSLRELIVQILQQDPRPSYQAPEPERVYGMKLLDVDIRWQYLPTTNGYTIHVIELAPI